MSDGPVAAVACESFVRRSSSSAFQANVVPKSVYFFVFLVRFLSPSVLAEAAVVVCITSEYRGLGELQRL